MQQGLTVAELIDRKPIGGFQLRIILLCFLTQLVDGFDNQAVAFVAPALADHWQIPRAAFGAAFGATAFGTLIGSLVIGPLGDWFGRKTLIVGALALAAMLMAATGEVQSVGQLVVLRFLTGLPLGALIPATVVVANEWSPLRHRSAMVTIMACGFAFGAVLGGLLSSVIIPWAGWPWVFRVGAIGTMLIGLSVLLWMPESLRFLSLRRSEKNARRMAETLRKFDAEAHVSAHRPAAAAERVSPVASLFHDGRWIMTLLLWAAFFMNMLALNFMTYWLPTLLGSAGLAPSDAIRMSTLFQIGGITGIVLMGLFADRLGPWRQIMAVYALSAIAVALVGSLQGGPRFAAIALAGFCIIGVQMSLSALCATLYPTAARATGASSALGIGRLGSTVGPVVGGMMLARSWDLPQIFGTIALCSAAGVVIVVLLARRVRVTAPRRTLAPA